MAFVPHRLDEENSARVAGSWARDLVAFCMSEDITPEGALLEDVIDKRRPMLTLSRVQHLVHEVISSRSEPTDEAP